MSRNDKEWLKKEMIVAFLFGVGVGFIRYKSGEYLLMINFAIAWLIPLITAQFIDIKISKEEYYNSKTFFPTLIVVFAFIFGELFVISFFEEPFEWLGDILSSRASEDMFLIVKDRYADGVSGGWWVFFNLLDLAFMHFGLIVFTNTEKEKQIDKSKR